MPLEECDQYSKKSPRQRNEALATKLGRGRPTEVECESNEDLKTLSNYLQNVTPPLEGTSFTLKNVRHHDLTLLKEILLSDSVKSASNIHVDYYLSKKEEEELSLLEETLGVVNVVVLVIAVYIVPQSWCDVGRVSRSFFRMQEQMDSLQFCMVKRSPDEVVDLLKALEGCRLSWLSLFDINLHARLQDINHIPSSLTILKFYGCRLVDDDVKDLISILPAGHGLRVLVLDFNAFSLDGLRALTHHLGGLYSLCGLSLCNNGLDPELVRQVVCHNLPRLKETEQGLFVTY
ncbi:uncharacterized protein LOC119733367 [Patiria miniata]|uniref:Uncharacterized protein n=1 Tax=Patiria miniata TaxID=46514 RepID=A0A914AFY5_PATMI|nr:uncharacterized protein LOC119733367 [Patiria miniata]